jgi:hypothetical protein
MGSLSYLIKFHSETQTYTAKSIKYPSVIGEGRSLSEAVDDLEFKIAKLQIDPPNDVKTVSVTPVVKR